MLRNVITAGTLVLALGCERDLTFATESDPVVLPNIAGNWTVSFTAYPAGSPDGTAGTCTGAMTMSLAKGQAVFWGDQFVGTHTRMTIRCSQLSVAALQTLGDTVMVIPVESVTANVAPNICGINFYIDPNCDPRAVHFYISTGALLLSGDGPTGRRMGGGVAVSREGGAVVLHGSFSAANDVYK